MLLRGTQQLLLGNEFCYDFSMHDWPYAIYFAKFFHGKKKQKSPEF